MPRPSATVRFLSKTVQGAVDAITVGFASMLREIEVAALTVANITFQEDEGCGRASAFVQGSKTDTEAKGVTRQLSCTCLAADCQATAVKRLCMGRQPFQHLVITREGTAVSNEAQIEAMKEYSRQHGMLHVTRNTGHSMRTTGAQRWAAAGLDLEMIQLFGRWERARQMMKCIRQSALSVKCTNKPREPIGETPCSPTHARTSKAWVESGRA